MGESTHQKKTIEYARDKGYLAKRNYMGPGCEVGWPDTEIFMSRGRVLLIEFKVPGKEPRAIQRYRISQLTAMGHYVATCYTFQEAKDVIDALGVL